VLIVRTLKRRPSAAGGPQRYLSYHVAAPAQQRPQAAALLHDASNPDRSFDAVVIGEYERAFSGRRAQLIIPQLQSCGIAVWLHEADGPVNLADSAHQALHAERAAIFSTVAMPITS
jgi:hypothetical protein